MSKFVVLYRVPVETMEEWRKKTSPEEMKVQSEKLGAAMIAWTKKNEASLIDKGLPLGKTTRMDAAGAHDAVNDLNYMCIVEAPSAHAVVEMFKDNPHFQAPTAFIDIMEVPHAGL